MVAEFESRGGTVGIALSEGGAVGLAVAESTSRVAALAVAFEARVPTGSAAAGGPVSGFVEV